MKKSLAVILCILMLVSVLPINSWAINSPNIETSPFEKILGVYDGSYTATQGITGLSLSIYRTEDLLNDNILLQKYADVASSCEVSSEENAEKSFTVEDVKSIIFQHSEEYIALFNFFPMVDKETGIGPNPDLEEGLYTMTIGYDESTEKYEFIGSQWIQHDTYAFADLKNITLVDDTLSGDVYGEYASWFWTEYGDVGDVSVCSGKGHSGYRIDFENESVSLGVNEKQQIKAVVKNNQGILASDKVNIKWFSNDENIAKINGENWDDTNLEYALGTIVGISEGVTEVYAELDNNRLATCTVVVSQNNTIAPLEIDTTYELISQIISSKDENVTTYKFAPHYKITATIKNPDVNAVTGVTVKLILPSNATIYGEYNIEKNALQIRSGGEISFTWEIVTEGDYCDTTEVQYWISAESDQSVEIFGRKTIFVEPFVGQDNRIDFNSDVWDFINTQYYYDKGHFINTEYYNSLINVVGNIERERIDAYLNSEWQGSCYGMSTIAALMKLGHLDPEDYKNASNVLKNLPAPKESDEIYSLITYYHMTQTLDAYYAALNANLRLDESDRLIELVNSVEKVKIGETPVLLSIWFMNKDYDIYSIENDYFSGHAILAYDVEYGNYNVKSIVDGSISAYDKRVLIYDPNNNEEPIFLYINSDFTKWIVDGYCQNRVSEDGLYWYKGEGYFSFVDEVDVLDSINIEDSIDNYYSKLVANINTELRIFSYKEDGTGEEFVVCGINIFEMLNDDVIAYVDSLCGEGTSSAFGYLFSEDVVELNIVPETGNSAIDLTYTFDGVSYIVQTQTGKQVFLSENKNVSVECNGAYSLTAMYDEGEYSSDWYYYCIEGICDGTISISQNEQGYTIISGDDLENVNLTVKSENNTLSKSFTTDKNSVMITNQGNTVAILLDSDSNGTYETDLNEYLKTQESETDKEHADKNNNYTEDNSPAKENNIALFDTLKNMTNETLIIAGASIAGVILLVIICVIVKKKRF